MSTVCEWFDLKTTQTVFTSLASKPVTTVSGGLASKPAVTVFSGLASKPVATVFSNLSSKLVAMVSSGLASKPVVGFLVEPQNQCGGGFSGLGLKTDSSDFVIWTSKLPRRFFGLDLKTKQSLVCPLSYAPTCIQPPEQLPERLPTRAKPRSTPLRAQRRAAAFFFRRRALHHGRATLVLLRPHHRLREHHPGPKHLGVHANSDLDPSYGPSLASPLRTTAPPWGALLR
jgi:hypothetical protein